MAKGFISQVNIKKRNYEVLNDDNLIYYLSFEECGESRFGVGDVIKFKAHQSNQYGNCVLNPVKLNNKYFDELSSLVGTSNTIMGYVYEKKEFGFNVTYNGFNCFLPSSETYLHNQKLEVQNNMLNTYQRFIVAEVKKGFIMLSRKDFLKDELKKLVKEEIETLNVGFTFIGKVKSVVNYGVFITNKYSEGLLHIKRIIPDYDINISKEEKNKLGVILEDKFMLSRAVAVTVEANENGKYSLIWNSEIKPNIEIYTEIKEAMELNKLPENTNETE